MKLTKAYNARSTRPLWHWFKPYDAEEGRVDWSGEPIRRALCGAKAREDLLDENTDAVHGCGVCDQRERKLTAK